jgi:hypothetical protein
MLAKSCVEASFEAMLGNRRGRKSTVHEKDYNQYQYIGIFSLREIAKFSR